jgi:hypothetical protein
MAWPSKDFRSYYTGKEGYPERRPEPPKRKLTTIEKIAYVAQFPLIGFVLYADHGWVLWPALVLYLCAITAQVVPPLREKRRARADKATA